MTCPYHDLQTCSKRFPKNGHLISDNLDVKSRPKCEGFLLNWNLIDVGGFDNLLQDLSKHAIIIRGL